MWGRQNRWQLHGKHGLGFGIGVGPGLGSMCEGMGLCACEEEGVGVEWGCDGVGEVRCVVGEGGVWRVVSDRKYTEVGMCGQGVLCLILCFNAEDGES